MTPIIFLQYAFFVVTSKDSKLGEKQSRAPIKSNFLSAIPIVLLGFTSCISNQGKPKMRFYHGEQPPPAFITVSRFSPQEIEFQISVSFNEDHLYHLVLDGDEPLSEGWFPTQIIGKTHYFVKMKAKEGVLFQAGKTYRLCIGAQNPELVSRYMNNYRCLVDYEFVLPEKK